MTVIASTTRRYIDHLKGKRDQTLTTPRTLFDRLHRRFWFTMDGAASSENTLLPRFSSIGAQRPWKAERVFCNPPWGSIPPFLELASEAEFALFLVPARVNAKWFHRALELGAALEFFLSKPQFGGCKWNSPVDCVLLKFGKERAEWMS